MSDQTIPHRLDADDLPGGTAPVRRAALALGSNLGDRFDTLQASLDSLAETPGVAIVAVSPVYESAAVGGPEGSPDFLNAVVIVETALPPGLLLDRALALEDAFGRVRQERWAPRTLDIDVLVVGNLVVDDGERLQVPHPRLAQRAFVLVPWAEVDADAEVPGAGTVRALLAAVDTSGVRRTDDVLLAAS